MGGQTPPILTKTQLLAVQEKMTALQQSMAVLQETSQQLQAQVMAAAQQTAPADE